MPAIEHAVISAAGIGSRLGLNKPKCLVEVGGRTLLAQHLERLVDIPTVWVVVGFQEELVIEQVRSLRRDAIIVRNPDFDRTNTLQSIHRVSRHLDGRFLAVDGDTFIENRSFERFLRAAAEHEGLVGGSRYTTSDGVRVLLNQEEGMVTAFTREPQHAFEWTGIAVLQPNMVVDQPIYVYQALESYLPLPAQELDAFDIDTAIDLDMARRVHLNNWNLND
ncbi:MULTISPECIES: NTP transferase domain-containing protein [Pseudomonas aeruginosa group]|uniref:NTP transferase domain-containing protein n=1 Tax=Pseudomonas aeruginosa group TaxID=136841 RepID=UPI00210AE07F|nr:NTP transferase domain-containing protein [Pseudomonas aeruginosa]MCW8022594.1 NTP transferase domain-containing protein [Pseudomonas aeruginosa]